MISRFCTSTITQRILLLVRARARGVRFNAIFNNFHTHKSISLDLFALSLFSYFVHHKTIGDNKICAECAFLLLKLQNLNPYRSILDWKTKKQTYTIDVRDNWNKEIHIPRTNFENSDKAKRSIGRWRFISRRGIVLVNISERFFSNLKRFCQTFLSVNCSTK